MYGSLATGFAHEESDLDVSLQGLNVRDRKDLDARIEALANSFRSSRLVAQCQPIATARIPVVKLVRYFMRITVGVNRNST